MRATGRTHDPDFGGGTVKTCRIVPLALAVFALPLMALALAACGEPPPRLDASSAEMLDSDSRVDDASEPAVDAVTVDRRVCSGAPVPTDLECVVQDARASSPCGGRGHYVFDGTLCQWAEGAECAGELGAFDTLEDCAVSCARAGYCNYIRVFDGFGEPTDYGCDEVRSRFVCELIAVQNGSEISDDCSVWGPFGRRHRGGPPVSGARDDAWLMLSSASLTQALGEAFCLVAP